MVRLAGGSHPGGDLVADRAAVWPRPSGERDALLLLGPEPDFRWRAFGDEVVEACRRLGVVEVFGLGAFPAPALHTDPVAVVGTSADSDLAARLETVPAIVELSSGIQTVLEERLHRGAILETRPRARVPPYLAGGTHPPAALALVETLARLAGVGIETTELEAATKDHLVQVEQAILASRPRSPSSSTRSGAWSSRARTSASPPATRSPPSWSGSSTRAPPEGGEPGQLSRST